MNHDSGWCVWRATIGTISTSFHLPECLFFSARSILMFAPNYSIGINHKATKTGLFHWVPFFTVILWMILIFFCLITLSKPPNSTWQHIFWFRKRIDPDSRNIVGCHPRIFDKSLRRVTPLMPRDSNWLRTQRGSSVKMALSQIGSGIESVTYSNHVNTSLFAGRMVGKMTPCFVSKGNERWENQSNYNWYW